MAVADINVPYYARRANEYDITTGYQRPKAAAAMAPIRARYQLAFQDEDVLEVACGTGYWTRTVAVTARSVLATDVNPEVIAVARERTASLPNVRFQVASAYSLDGVEGPFTAAFAQFWWSHVPVSDLRRFLTGLHSKLRPGSRVMFLDGLRSVRRRGRRFDEAGDLLEERVLLDGTRFEIIKNFPTADEMNDVLAGIAEQVVYKEYPANGVWVVSYRTKPSSI
jgi:demethylmenaquinone methyltransferase/2-methoxy-6-polyprenyl-1,4-benzoquinol methylase